ncbi:rhodanese-related sulfurtransferase [Candidatus Woesearchaeota archaeon]|nr:rhodanese-related sulfurtransferase [Candidatus Woesearchaeota archaeon]
MQNNIPEIKIVSSFYKYVKIHNPLEFQQKHLEFCLLLGLKGRILVGEEGINGCVYGTKGQIEEYKNGLMENSLFSDIEFKDTYTEKPAYRKMFVRVRKEIVYSGLDVDLKNTGKFLTPIQLKEMLDRNEDIALVDMRNGYEFRIGRFRNAISLPIENFRDLPKAVKNIESLKNKKIVAYCTGGIRCEKATAFLNENGFKDVCQIKGGILKYGEEFPDTYWEGKCFVFDDRLAIQINRFNTWPLEECAWCKKKCDDYMNCHNLDCDKLFICCENCKEMHNKSCSGECRISPKRRKETILIEN